MFLQKKYFKKNMVPPHTLKCFTSMGEFILTEQKYSMHRTVLLSVGYMGTVMIEVGTAIPSETYLPFLFIAAIFCSYW
jgi:hypothetical protein